MNQMTSSDTQPLQQLSEEWAAAERQGDAAFFQRTLTDDFVGVGPLGFMLTKADAVQRFTSGNLKYESFSWEDVKVRTYGEAAVILSNMHQAAPAGARTFVAEYIVPGPETPHFSKLFDIHMLCATSGRERTEDEYAALFDQAGWQYVKAWYPASKLMGGRGGAGLSGVLDLNRRTRHVGG